MKNKSIEIVDMGKNNTMLFVQIHSGHLMPKREWKQYMEEAKDILDGLSKDLNPVGIDLMIAALTLLKEGDYNGKNNHHATKKPEDEEAVYTEILKETEALIEQAKQEMLEREAAESKPAKPAVIVED